MAKTAPAILVLVLSLTLPCLALASTWHIDPDHSHVGFKVRHLMVSNVKGVFHKVSGIVKIDDRDIVNSSVSATIDTASIDTNLKRRDDDLRSEKFLDVARYPTMKFVSTKVTRGGADKLKVTGDLTLHGVTRPVLLDVDAPSREVKDAAGNIRRGASAATRINRKDFGLNWNKAMEAGGVLVGDEVSIEIEVEMVKGAGE